MLIMTDQIWNVILHQLHDNQLQEPVNNPAHSGRYLCTCVQTWNGEEVARYLQVMEYDAEKKYWHDCGNKHGISHHILAWTDQIMPCSYKDYTYLVGGYFLKN